MVYNLECRYNTKNSFYGKANVEETKNNKKLYSYGTLVAKIIETKNSIKYYYLGHYSSTTTRHQKEFFKQNNLSEKEIKKLFKNGILEKEVL